MNDLGVTILVVDFAIWAFLIVYRLSKHVREDEAPGRQRLLEKSSYGQMINNLHQRR